MKISEVINKLQEIQKEHGDLEVFVYDSYYCNRYLLEEMINVYPGKVVIE